MLTLASQKQEVMRGMSIMTISKDVMFVLMMKMALLCTMVAGMLIVIESLLLLR